jgi:xylulokinase
LLAGVAGGAWPDVAAACAATVQLAEVTAPDDRRAAAYESFLFRYQALYPALKETNTALAGLES